MELMAAAGSFLWNGSVYRGLERFAEEPRINTNRHEGNEQSLRQGNAEPEEEDDATIGNPLSPPFDP